MKARLASGVLVGVLAVAAATGCGGNAGGGKTAPRREGAARPEVTAQVAARTLIATTARGGCGCTGEARARERIADGRATRRTEPVVLGG